ncbi:MAG: flagellar export chaperone FliS [Halioglobus sp.]|nr:flagellar export chaperone FliS [Halioglobus sp.]
MNPSALKQYQDIGVNSGLTDANSHQLIAMLLAGAADRVASARGAIQRGEVAARGELISKAISIIDNLRASLDHERGGEVAGNLAALYDYMEQGLVEANLSGDPARLEEIGALLGEIKAGWDAIPADKR